VRRQPVQWFRDHPQIWDALLAAVLGALSIIGLLTVDAEAISPSHRDPDALGVALTIGVWSAVAVRRRWPEATTWVVAALIIPFWVLDYVDVGTTIGVLIAIYTLAAHVDRPRSLQVGVFVGLALVAVMVSGVVAEQEDLPAIAVVGNIIIFATAWTVGDSVRSRRAYLAEVEARAEAAERDREQAAERAVQEERVRIARELHDVVAHSVSVMVVQAAAAHRIIDRDPERSAEALGVIEHTGRTALEELRRLLGVLREEGTAETVPQPSADDVPALVERCRDAGLEVSLQVVGARPDLSAGASLAVYRIVQEALTNVMKHAGPARAAVSIRYGAEVAIEVSDDGRGPRCDPDLSSSGQGLIGMRERVELYGGSLDVGPRPGGGFRVRVSVPVAAVSAA
jgi:signal transduction histidine kinase